MSHPELFEQCEEQVQQGQLKVTEACKKMNIAISTYYVLRKKYQEKTNSSIASTISTAKKHEVWKSHIFIEDYCVLVQ